MSSMLVWVVVLTIFSHKAVTIGLRLSLVLDDGVLVFPCASVRTKFKSRTQIKMVMVTVLESLAPIGDGRRR